MTSPWPLFDLRIRTARLELRAPTDEDLTRLLAVAGQGVHDPAEMPFIVPWTDLRPPEFERSFLRFYWGTRASWSPDDWHLPLVVAPRGEPVQQQRYLLPREDWQPEHYPVTIKGLEGCLDMFLGPEADETGR